MKVWGQGLKGSTSPLVASEKKKKEQMMHVVL